MIQAQIVVMDGKSKRILNEMLLSERPPIGSKIDGRYKVVSINDPVPIGTNLSAGDPVMAIQICVEEL